MPELAVPYTQCDYFSLKGLCIKRCLGDRCHSNRNRESLKPCKNKCNGTKSISGFCAKKLSAGIVTYPADLPMYIKARTLYLPNHYHHQNLS